MYYTVYKITNLANGKIYIGCHKTTNLDDGYMGSGKYLKRAIEKHGMENFTKEILAVFDNPDSMFDMESKIVNEEFLSREDVYNLKSGGSGGFDYINTNGLDFKGFVTRAERLRSINPFLNREKYSQEFFEECQMKAKVGLSKYLSRVDLSAIIKEDFAAGKRTPGFLGKTHSQEARDAIGTANAMHQQGIKNSQFGTMWITNGIESKKIKKDDTIPGGWKRGRIIKMADVPI